MTEIEKRLKALEESNSGKATAIIKLKGGTTLKMDLPAAIVYAMDNSKDIKTISLKGNTERQGIMPNLLYYLGGKNAKRNT